MMAGARAREVLPSPSGPTGWVPTMTHTRSKNGLAKIGSGQNWPNQDGQNGICQSRSLPFERLQSGQVASPRFPWVRIGGPLTAARTQESCSVLREPTFNFESCRQDLEAVKKLGGFLMYSYQEDASCDGGRDVDLGPVRCALRRRLQLGRLCGSKVRATEAVSGRRGFLVRRDGQA